MVEEPFRSPAGQIRPQRPDLAFVEGGRRFLGPCLRQPPCQRQLRRKLGTALPKVPAEEADFEVFHQVSVRVLRQDQFVRGAAAHLASDLPGQPHLPGIMF